MTEFVIVDTTEIGKDAVVLIVRAKTDDEALKIFADMMDDEVEIVTQEGVIALEVVVVEGAT